MPAAAKVREPRRSAKPNSRSSQGGEGGPRLVSPKTGVRSQSVLIALSALLAISTLAIYSPIRNHPFVNYDDFTYVVDNQHVKQGLSWDTFTWSLSSTEQSNWHPLTWLSHALDFELYGLNATGHHWTSLILHIFNVVLLFLLLQKVTGATWRSLFVAGLFALHPLNVESVAWIAERKNVLSTLFFFAALGSYGWYARRPSVGRYLALTLLFVLGLASKPMVITLPFVLLLLDFWPLKRVKGWSAPSEDFPVPQFTFGRMILEKLPLLAICVGSAIITLIAQRQTEVSTFVLPIGVRLRTIPYAYCMYLWKFIWPAKLALIYPHPGLTLPWVFPLLGAVLLLALTIFVWSRRKRQPYLLAGWLWFLGTAVPVIGLVQVGDQVIADRYAYVPLVGILVAIVWGISELADDVKLNRGARAAVAGIVFAALSFLTWRQISYWGNTVDLWQHALQVTSNNSMAENFLADELFLKGRYDEGMVHLRNYAKLEPFDPMAHVRVAADFEDRGELNDAVREFEAGIRGANALQKRGLPSLGPQAMAMTYANVAVLYSELGDDLKAQTSMRQALKVDAGAVDHMMGQLVQALSVNRKAQGYLRLGYLLKLIGQDQDAQQAFAWAKRLDPNVHVPGGS